MTQIFTEQGDVLGVTLVEVEPVCILERRDYPTKSVVRVGVRAVTEKHLSKPMAGYFKKIGVKPYKYIREIPIDKNTDLSFLTAKPADGEEKKETPSREVGVEMFKEGELVHARAKTKGRGFQGGVKRHGWWGQPASHGHMTHRRIGSAGSNTYPGRTLRGLRMPGHMGNKFLTIRNLKVVKIDSAKQLLFLEGSVPGARGSFVKIRKA